MKSAPEIVKLLWEMSVEMKEGRVASKYNLDEFNYEGLSHFKDKCMTYDPEGRHHGLQKTLYYSHGEYFLFDHGEHIITVDLYRNGDVKQIITPNRVVTWDYGIITTITENKGQKDEIKIHFERGFISRYEHLGKTYFGPPIIKALFLSLLGKDLVRHLTHIIYNV